MAELVPYRQGRLSRKRLREWLLAVGPQSLEAIHFQANIQSPTVTSEEVERQLTEHPDFFARSEQGQWYAVEAEPRAVVIRPKLGARDVRHVPPSWEDYLDKATIRAKLVGADYAVEITDFVKHDAQDAVRSLQTSGLGLRYVPTSGGPSRIVRTVLERAAAEAA